MFIPGLDICPILRLFVPFALGVFFGKFCFFEDLGIPFWISGITILLLIAILLVVYKSIKKYSLRWLFGVPAFLLFFVLGSCWTNLRLHQTVVDFLPAETVYRAVITDKPERKETSILCSARLLNIPDSVSSYAWKDKSVLLYFPIDSSGTALQRGDELLFSARLSLPENRGNPDEFDYAKYLIYKGISGTVYLNSGKWKIINHNTTISIRDYASDCRDEVLSFYRHLGFEGDTFAVLAALTVGYKEELSEAIQESFSISGASHVLALSGLHIGFLYALLFFLLNKLPGSSRWVQSIRIVFIIVILWAFALITGLSPSVVRSVIMFSLLAISLLFTGRAVSLNTLSVTALGMLIYNPCWLFDVGFQLSFIAVAAILLIHPWLYERFSVTNPYLKKIWGLISISIAAQVGTAPLVLFYFSRFSVHFLLTNILVIPLVTIIIYVAIVMLVLSFVPFVSQLIAFILKDFIELLNGIVAWIEHLPFASIDRVWIYKPELLFIYLILALLTTYVIRRNPKHLIAGLSFILVFTTYRVWMTNLDHPQESVIFYNVRNCPAVHFTSSTGKSWLAYADTLPDQKRLTRTVSNYWNRLRLSAPVVVTGDYQDAHIIRLGNLLSFNNKRVCIVNDNYFERMKADMPFAIDYAYVCKGYTGKIKQLATVFAMKQIVFDASLPEYRRMAFQEECKLLGIPCISVSEQSSYFKSTF